MCSLSVAVLLIRDNTSDQLLTRSWNLVYYAPPYQLIPLSLVHHVQDIKATNDQQGEQVTK